MHYTCLFLFLWDICGELVVTHASQQRGAVCSLSERRYRHGDAAHSPEIESRGQTKTRTSALHDVYTAVDIKMYYFLFIFSSRMRACGCNSYLRPDGGPLAVLRTSARGEYPRDGVAGAHLHERRVTARLLRRSVLRLCQQLILQSQRRPRRVSLSRKRKGVHPFNRAIRERRKKRDAHNLQTPHTLASPSPSFPFPCPAPPPAK